VTKFSECPRQNRVVGKIAPSPNQKKIMGSINEGGQGTDNDFFRSRLFLRTTTTAPKKEAFCP